MQPVPEQPAALGTLKLEELFKDIYLGEDEAADGDGGGGGGTAAAVSATVDAAAATPVAPAAVAGKARGTGDKALERATATANSTGGAAAAAAPMPLTTRNLVLKEKMERKAEGKRGGAPRGDVVAADDEELRAIEGVRCALCAACCVLWAHHRPVNSMEQRTHPFPCVVVRRRARLGCSSDGVDWSADDNAQVHCRVPSEARGALGERARLHVWCPHAYVLAVAAASLVADGCACMQRSAATPFPTCRSKTTLRWCCGRPRQRPRRQAHRRRRPQPRPRCRRSCVSRTRRGGTGSRCRTASPTSARRSRRCGRVSR